MEQGQLVIATEKNLQEEKRKCSRDEMNRTSCPREHSLQGFRILTHSLPPPYLLFPAFLTHSLSFSSCLHQTCCTLHFIHPYHIVALPSIWNSLPAFLSFTPTSCLQAFFSRLILSFILVSVYHHLRGHVHGQAHNLNYPSYRSVSYQPF